MAAPLKKNSVNLGAKGAPGSRIRRNPPPVAKKTVVPDRDEIDRRAVAIGVIGFGLAIVVIVLALGGWAGRWSPSHYTVVVGETGADREPVRE